jgi:hypothetical protein
MRVEQLIEELKKMPQKAKVFHIWDGEPRTAINMVYKARCGKVMTADWGEVCYSTEYRPKDAPTKKEDRYWSLPENPKKCRGKAYLDY